MVTTSENIIDILKLNNKEFNYGWLAKSVNIPRAQYTVKIKFMNNIIVSDTLGQINETINGVNSGTSPNPKRAKIQVQQGNLVSSNVRSKTNKPGPSGPAGPSGTAGPSNDDNLSLDSNNFSVFSITTATADTVDKDIVKMEINENLRYFKLFVLLRVLFLADQIHDFTEGRVLSEIGDQNDTNDEKLQKRKEMVSIIINNLGKRTIKDCYSFMRTLFPIRDIPVTYDIYTSDNSDVYGKYIKKFKQIQLIDGLLFNYDTFFTSIHEFLKHCIQYGTNTYTTKPKVYEMAEKITNKLGYYKQDVYEYLTDTNDLPYFCKQGFAYLKLFTWANLTFITPTVKQYPNDICICVDADKSKYGVSDILKEVCNLANDDKKTDILFYKNLASKYDASGKSGTEKVIEDLIIARRLSRRKGKLNAINDTINITPIQDFSQKEHFVLKIGQYTIMDFSLNKIINREHVFVNLIDEYMAEKIKDSTVIFDNFFPADPKTISTDYSNFKKNFKARLYIIFLQILKILKLEKITIDDIYNIHRENDFNINIFLVFLNIDKKIPISLSNINNLNLLIEIIGNIVDTLRDPRGISIKDIKYNTMISLKFLGDLQVLFFKPPRDFDDINSDIYEFLFKNGDTKFYSITKLPQTRNPTNRLRNSGDIDNSYKIMKDFIDKKTISVKLIINNFFKTHTPLASTNSSVKSIFDEIKTTNKNILQKDDLSLRFAKKTLGDFSQILSFMVYKTEKSNDVYLQKIGNKFFITFDKICANISSIFNYGTLFEESGNNLSPLIPYINTDNHELIDIVTTLSNFHTTD